MAKEMTDAQRRKATAKKVAEENAAAEIALREYEESLAAVEEPEEET